MGKFYLSCLSLAFRHSIGIADSATAIIVALFILVSKLFGWETVREIDLWWLILAAVGVVFIIRLILAPYWIYKDIKKERDEARTQLRKIQEDAQKTSPRIIVTPKIHNNQATLKIHNDGVAATFKATARIIDGVRQGFFYGLGLSPEPLINTNDDAQILLAEMVNKYVFLYQENRRFPLLTQEAYEEHKLKKSYPNSYLEMSHGKEPPEDECTLEVMITSDPSPIEATKPIRYHLGKDDKGSLVFKEIVSDSHKEDSHTEQV